MIIHGHVPGAGDPAQGGKAALITAGRQEVERGLDRIEGKPTAGEGSGVGDGTGATPTTAPQATTAAPRAEPTSQEARGAAADISHPLDNGAAANGTRGHGPASEQRHDERTQAAAITAPPHDRPIAANGTGIQRDTDMRQQRNGTDAGDQDNLDMDTAATVSPSDRPTADDGPPGAQRDTDVRQHVQGNGSATGTSVHDIQTRIAGGSAADASDSANAAAGGDDSPAASGSPGVQGDTDMRLQGNETVTGDQDKLDKDTAATATPSDRPIAADGLPGAQRDTDVRQQVEGNGPATGTSVHDIQTRTAADASDPANAFAGGNDSPAALGSPGVQSDTDMRLQGNETVTGEIGSEYRNETETA
jgi:hypothetical protein